MENKLSDITSTATLGLRTSSAMSSRMIAIEKLQNDLKDDMRAQIGGHVYEFSTDDIVCMLSPKRIKEDALAKLSESNLTLQISDYDLLVNEPDVKTALGKLSAAKFSSPEDRKKPSYYYPIINFLNDTLTSCETEYTALYSSRCLEHQARELSTKFSLGGPRGLGDKSRWWSRGIHFRCYDKTLKVKVEDAHFLEPDVIGVEGRDAPAEYYWSVPDGVEGAAIRIPVAVEEDWCDLAAQSAAYARAIFSANPFLGFVVVIAFNHKSGHLRFLIFHRGGITATRKLNVENEDARRDIAKILLSILLWQTATDAGYPSFTDGLNVQLPPASTTNNPTKAQITSVIHSNICCRGRATHVSTIVDLETTRHDEFLFPPRYQGHSHPLCPKFRRDRFPKFEEGAQEGFETGVMKLSWAPLAKENLECNVLQACSGRYGAPTLITAFQVCRDDGSPATNEYFLPTEERDRVGRPLLSPGGAHWDVFGSGKPAYKDYRRQCCSVTTDVGDKFTVCEDARDLRTCMWHAALGWFTVFQEGFMQRDVSIGNLIKLKYPDKRPVVNFVLKPVTKLLQDIYLDDEGEHTVLGLIEQSPSNSALRIQYEQVEEAYESLEKKLKSCKPWPSCSAIIVDFDLSAALRDNYFASGRAGELMGTLQFRSVRLSRALESGITDVLHCPLDDLESFVWVGLWAIVNHASHQANTEEKRWRAGLYDTISNRWGTLDSMMTWLDETEYDPNNNLRKGYNPMYAEILPMLRKVYESLKKLFVDWSRDTYYVNNMSDGLEKHAVLHELFLKYALLGLEVVLAICPDTATVVA